MDKTDYIHIVPLLFNSRGDFPKNLGHSHPLSHAYNTFAHWTKKERVRSNFSQVLSFNPFMQIYFTLAHLFRFSHISSLFPVIYASNTKVNSAKEIKNTMLFLELLFIALSQFRLG